MQRFQPDEITAAVGGVIVAGAGGREITGVSTDTRTLQPGDLFVALRGPRYDGHDFIGAAFSRGAAGAVVDRWPLRTPLEGTVWKAKDTLQALEDLARFHRNRFHPHMAAVTGSSGKTTAKSMCEHILSGSVLLAGPHELLVTPGTQNNRIGVPMALLRLTPQHRVAVIEVGTNQWGEVRRLAGLVRPTMAIVTQIGPAHLETFGDLEGVLREKSGIWEGMGPDGILILNADDPLLWEAGKKAGKRLVGFGLSAEAAVRAREVRLYPWGSRCVVNEQTDLKLQIPGRHNLMNALAALACAEVLGEEMGWAARRLASFDSLPGRLAQREVEGCLLIDDSYNANPASLRAALDVLQGVGRPGRRILVVGDMLELGKQAEMLHAEAGRWVASARIDLLVTVGMLTRHLLQAAVEHGFPKGSAQSFETAEEAGRFVASEMRSGDTVLLKGSRGMRLERVLECSITSSIR